MPPVTDSSSSSTSLQPPGHAHQFPSRIPIQLTKENYFLWKSLFISVLRASDMLDLAEGREQCPPQSQTLAHANWIKRDQTLLTWINSALSVSLLGRTKEFTSGRALWLHLENLLAEDAMTYVGELRDRLRNLDVNKFRTEKKYLETAKQIADALEEAGSPVHDSEFVSFVLNGLPDLYDGFVASIMDRPEPVTREQLQEQLDRHVPGSVEIAFMSGYWVFGNKASSNILENLMPDEGPSLALTWVLGLAVVFVLLQLLAIGLSCLSAFVMEKLCHL
ncbi:hypothetical protein ACLB2K_051462 [Fragaria x ananassa]